MRNIPKNLGLILMAIWLIVTGVLQVVKLPIPDISLLLAVLAIVAGLLILLERAQGGKTRWGF